MQLTQTSDCRFSPLSSCELETPYTYSVAGWAQVQPHLGGNVCHAKQYNMSWVHRIAEVLLAIFVTRGVQREQSPKFS